VGRPNQPANPEHQPIDGCLGHDSPDRGLEKWSILHTPRGRASIQNGVQLPLLAYRKSGRRPPMALEMGTMTAEAVSGPPIRR